MSATKIIFFSKIKQRRGQWADEKFEGGGDSSTWKDSGRHCRGGGEDSD